jgi:serine/threonine-protein kinase RsbW
VQPAATLLLPRERHTVRVARALLESTLRSVGVTPPDIADLAVALSEACSNAVRHASGAPCYEVEILIDEQGCTIRVTDEGAGFDPHGAPVPPPTAQGGRGLALMDALVDRFEIDASKGTGSRITLYKRLSHRSCRLFLDDGSGYGHQNSGSQRSEEATMGEKADEMKGRAKEAGGDLTDNDDMKREGKVDQATSSVKEKAGEAADKVRDVVSGD